MTAIVMEDVNAVYTLECAHRWQLLAAPSLTEKSFPRTKTIGDVYIDDLVIHSVLHFSDVHADSSSIEVKRADALYDFLQMPSNAGKSSSTLAAEFWTALQARSGSLLLGEFRSCSSRCWSLP